MSQVKRDPESGHGHFLDPFSLLAWRLIGDCRANVAHERGNLCLIYRLMRTGLVLTFIGDLEGSQERIHVHVCQFRVLVHIFGVQVMAQIIRIGWSPRCQRFPQSAVTQNFLNHFVLGWINSNRSRHKTVSSRS